MLVACFHRGKAWRSEQKRSKWKNSDKEMADVKLSLRLFARATSIFGPSNFLGSQCLIALSLI